MQARLRISAILSLILVVGVPSSVVLAQPRDDASRPRRGASFPLSYTPAGGFQQVPPESQQPAEDAEKEAPDGSLWGYRGISSFFNIREANSNVHQGEWEFEVTFKWFTASGEGDEFELAQSLKYGFTDDFHIELEVEQPRLGEGNESGAGDMQLTLFYRILPETEILPAIGAFGRMRIPSGDGSSGVDGTLAAAITKTFGERFRLHFQGFITTANGSSGAGGDERRHFQWGLGPGFDFLINDETLIGLNYLHRVNPEQGARNQNILEFEFVRELGHIANAESGLKLALDVGVDGAATSPNLGVKVLWSLEW